MENYIQKEKLLIREEICSLVSEIDTIIFDVDGVLVDVSQSFHQTIIETVQHYFQRILNIPAEEKIVNKETVASFKLIGGFNDDWELTATIILFYLWKMEKYKLKNAKDLIEKKPYINNFARDNLADGRGITSMLDWLRNNTQNYAGILQKWDKEKIFQIAREYYAGEADCFELYGFQPSIAFKKSGNIAKEKIIIASSAKNKLVNYKIGILSGRNRTEANYIIKKIGWDSWLDPSMTVTSDDGMNKPSPEGLKYFVDKFATKTGLFIGDTMDDLLTVINLNIFLKKQKFLSAIVIGDSTLESFTEKKKIFMKKNVDIIAGNVNKIIEFI